MSWKIINVDNGKKVYTLRRETGHIVTVAVPPEHHGAISAEAYVNAVMAGHDHAINNPAKKPGFFKRLFGKK